MMRLGLIAVTVLCFASMMQCYPSGFLRRAHVRGHDDGEGKGVSRTQLMEGFNEFNVKVGEIRAAFEEQNIQKVEDAAAGMEKYFDMSPYIDAVISVPQHDLPFSSDTSMDECVVDNHPFVCFARAAARMQEHSDLQSITEEGMTKIELIRRILSVQALMSDVGEFLSKNGWDLANYVGEDKRSETPGKDTTIQDLRDLLQKALYTKRIRY